MNASQKINMEEINFIIVGAQKSGSTFLHHCIASNDSIYMPDGETPIFESPDWENGGFEKFIRNIKKLNIDKLTGIKRPKYLYMNDVPSRIKHKYSSAKIIAVLRNPLDRFKSAYFHYMRSGFLPPLPLNIGTNMLLDGKLNTKWKRSNEILEFSIYAPGIRQYLKYFDRQQCCFITYDDLVRDPALQMEKIFTFLGVANKFNKTLLCSNPQKVEYGLLRLCWSSLINRCIYEYNDDRTRLFPKNEKGSFDKIALKSWSFADKAVRRLLPNYKSAKPDYNEKTINRLKPIFTKDILETEALTGINLSAWKS